MKTSKAMSILASWDKKGRYVFSKKDLSLVFDESGTQLKQSLQRFVKADLLVHAARDTYVYAYSKHVGAYTLEVVAQSLRRGEYNYLSYESALSDWGIISQIPFGRITVATTGRKGEFPTPYGVIEFTHTSRNPLEIIHNTIERPSNPLRIANAGFALQNIRDARRSLELLDLEDYEEDLQWQSV